nr:site-specific integrase [Gammaproteobacteria bacterium]
NQVLEAENLLKASSHWLRHTGISDSINKYERPIAHVRDDAGHASIATTDRYNDITLLERHNSARKSRIEF